MCFATFARMEKMLSNLRLGEDLLQGEVLGVYCADCSLPAVRL